jgi:DNA invertase Pin-like site-specific DNA recombinase
MRENAVYGYCRISRKTQKIERQIENISKAYPNAIIIHEAYTGTKLDGREGLKKIIDSAISGDTIVFDSVSRMSRNAEEGFNLYEQLYEQGINLVFLKEPHINTDTYRQAIQNSVPMTGTDVDYILEGINKYLMSLAKEQIKIAFDQAQKEVDDLHQRTSEGLKVAKAKGKQVGQVKGSTLKIKKKEPMKAKIKKLSRDFDGSNTDAEVIKLTGLARNTYYKYKKELAEGR